MSSIKMNNKSSGHLIGYGLFQYFGSKKVTGPSLCSISVDLTNIKSLSYMSIRVKVRGIYWEKGRKNEWLSLFNRQVNLRVIEGCEIV